jgi:hypothetical protein
MSQVGGSPGLHGTSVVPSRADVARPPRQVRFVPTSDIASFACCDDDQNVYLVIDDLGR